MNSPALGELEQLVLLAIVRLAEKVYDGPSSEKIGHRTGVESLC